MNGSTYTFTASYDLMFSTGTSWRFSWSAYLQAQTRAEELEDSPIVDLTNEVYMHVASALCRKPTVDSTHMSWDQVVGTETSYELEVEGLGFPDRLRAHPASHSVDIGVLSWG